MKEKQRPADFEKLPERFKRYIADLESSLSRLEAAQPVKEKTNVKLVDYLHEDGGRFLPSDSKIEFDCGKGAQFIVQIVNVKHGFVGIEVMSSNGTGFNVLPRASNSIVVATDEIAHRHKPKA